MNPSSINTELLHSLPIRASLLHDFARLANNVYWHNLQSPDWHLINNTDSEQLSKHGLYGEFYLNHKLRVAVIVFRGAYTFQDVITSLGVALHKPPRTFDLAFEYAERLLEKASANFSSYRWYVVGHSLGGVLAQCVTVGLRDKMALQAVAIDSPGSWGPVQNHQQLKTKLSGDEHEYIFNFVFEEVSFIASSGRQLGRVIEIPLHPAVKRKIKSNHRRAQHYHSMLLMDHGKSAIADVIHSALNNYDKHTIRHFEKTFSYLAQMERMQLSRLALTQQTLTQRFKKMFSGIKSRVHKRFFVGARQMITSFYKS